MFGRLLRWYIIIIIYIFRGSCPLTEFWQVHCSLWRSSTIDMGRKLGAVPLLREAGSPSNTVWSEPTRPRPTSILSGILTDINRHGPKIRGGSWLCPFSGGGAGSPCNTMWPGTRPTSMRSFILIHPVVWPQYTNVTERQTDRRTDRQTGQRSDSIGRIVLQTVAQKRHRYVCHVKENNG